jgi:hypothetical protein
MIVSISVKKHVKAYILRVYGTELRAKGNDELSQEIELVIASLMSTSTLNTKANPEASIQVQLTPNLAKLYRQHEQYFTDFDTFFLRSFDHALFNFVIGQYIIFGEINKSILAFYELYKIEEDDLPVETAYKRFQRFCAANTAARLLWQDINKAYAKNENRRPKRWFDKKKTSSFLLLQ